jgi:glycosyltransferase involved in cell wall biosynthesis
MTEQQAPEISVVIPLYNEEESLPELAAWIERVMLATQLSYEVLFVDDGSHDQSWEQIVAICNKNPCFRGFRLNRNYGKSAALQVGFQKLSGKVVITMDADLQDSPDEIPELYRMIREDKYHLVSGWKKKRHDPLSKTIPSKLFNRVTQAMSGIKLHDFNCGLKSYDARVVKAIRVYGEMHRYIPVIAKWNGFNRIGEKVVEHRPRKYGVTKFGLERFIFGFLDLLSIMFVSKFRKRPMHLFGSLGTISFFFGFAVAFWLTAQKFYYAMQNILVRNVTDQPLFFLALVAIIVGVQLFLAGFLGEMMQSLVRRDEYVVAEEV